MVDAPSGAIGTAVAAAAAAADAAASGAEASFASLTVDASGGGACFESADDSGRVPVPVAVAAD